VVPGKQMSMVLAFVLDIMLFWGVAGGGFLEALDFFMEMLPFCFWVILEDPSFISSHYFYNLSVFSNSLAERSQKISFLIIFC
jgi:hypothetical protein